MNNKKSVSLRRTVRLLVFMILSIGLLGLGPRAYAESRTIDGTGNNLANPEWGSAGIQLLRTEPAYYLDGYSEPAGYDRPSPRVISNIVAAQSASVLNRRRASDFVWQWGQFLDHDIGLTPPAAPPEPFNIPVPVGDPHFDPHGTGEKEIPLNRSVYDPDTRIYTPRQQMNRITAFIDASNVYGSDLGRAAALRTPDGTGRLKTGEGNLLPYNMERHNMERLPNDNPTGLDPSALFLAGDVRANEQVALTALHTLFVREHNRLADEIRGAHPQLSGDEIYERARAIVGAEMQVIIASDT